MARITWQYQNALLGWKGNVGTRVAFLATPYSDSEWSLKFIWTGAQHRCATVTESRGIAEKMLADFAEQTGLVLPEEREEENTLAQELIERLRSEVRWFKDGETDEQRAGYVATQALMVFDELIEAQRNAVDDSDTTLGTKVYTELDTLNRLRGLIQAAQSELGVEVEREVK